MTDDLVKCLRNRANGIMHWVTVERMASEAADRIEAQMKLMGASGRVHVSMLARIEELEAALQSIAANTCCDSCREAAKVARAALGEKKDD